MLVSLSVFTAIFILVIQYATVEVIEALITFSKPVKIVASVVVIFPMGMLLGCFFPTAMNIVKPRGEGATPWYWALNGIFGVFFSVLAVFISIFLGIAMNFYVAATCYLLTGLCFYLMMSPRNSSASAV